MFFINKEMTDYESYYYVYAVTDSIVEIRSSLKDLWIPSSEKYRLFEEAQREKERWQSEIDKMKLLERYAENEYE